MKGFNCKQFKNNAFQFLSIVEILHSNTRLGPPLISFWYYYSWNCNDSCSLCASSALFMLSSLCLLEFPHYIQDLLDC